MVGSSERWQRTSSVCGIGAPGGLLGLGAGHLDRVRALILALANGIDLGLGEPQASLHPAVGLDRVIGAVEQRPPVGPRARLLYGAPSVGALTAGWAEGAALSQQTSSRLPRPARLASTAWLLKTSFSLRGVTRAAAGCAKPLGIRTS
jgi:cobalamin biosynthesis protein CobD/CbiB